MSEELKYSGWRPLRGHKPPFPPGAQVRFFKAEDFEKITPTRFFDKMCFIGNQFIGCFLLETKEGLMMIDCLEPSDYFVELIEDGIRALGHEPEELKVMLITHGHNDHYGKCHYFKEKYGTKIYMSQIDEAFGQDPSHVPPGKENDYLKCDADGYLEDGQTFSFGGQDVQCYATPGHTPGCMSMIIPVTDEGRPHKVCLWGGTGIPRAEEDKKIYLESALRFKEICKNEGVDCEVSNHPFVDQIDQRLAICRDIVDGVANPFVIGEEAIGRYMDMFIELCKSRMNKAEWNG